MAPTALLRVIEGDGAESGMQVAPLRRLHEPACYQYRVAPKPVGGLTKRAFDVFAAVSALIALAPFLLAVAALIRLESRGPALYRQRRTGFRGRAFTILKFRTMTTMEDGRRLTQARPGDAVLCAEGKLDGKPVVICAMEYDFMGGSMGSVVGEKITVAVERAVDKKLPLVIVSCSGGARMQEGILSLMQMAKISASLERLREAGLPYISVMTDPTTGGVTASFAMLGDVHIAEPGALIGFAGARVIEQTIREKLPAGFQRAEYLRDHGMVDMVVHRHEMRPTLARLCRLLMKSPALDTESKPAPEVTDPTQIVSAPESVPAAPHA